MLHITYLLQSSTQFYLPNAIDMITNFYIVFKFNRNYTYEQWANYAYEQIMEVQLALLIRYGAKQSLAYFEQKLFYKNVHNESTSQAGLPYICILNQGLPDHQVALILN